MATENNRKRILESTLKEIFALSGNRCAYPSCSNPLYDEAMLAKVCHIVGVHEGSARYRPMSPEDLRRSSNLVLMCGHCHTKVDDKELARTKYTEEWMSQTKENHESKMTSAFASMDDQLADLLQGTPDVIRPKNALRYCRDVNLVGEEEETGTLDFINQGIDELAQVTREGRLLLAAIMLSADIPTGNVNYPLWAEIHVVESRLATWELEGGVPRIAGYLEREGWITVEDPEGTETYTHFNAPDSRHETRLELLCGIARIAGRSDDRRGAALAALMDLDFRLLEG